MVLNPGPPIRETRAVPIRLERAPVGIYLPVLPHIQVLDDIKRTKGAHFSLSFQGNA